LFAVSGKVLPHTELTLMQNEIDTLNLYSLSLSLR
jgi:hypothetical protein